MRCTVLFLIVLTVVGCDTNVEHLSKFTVAGINQDFSYSKIKGDVKEYYAKHKGCDEPSKALGTVSSGSLVNGCLMPFSGKNFTYFDTTSYLSGRAFSSDVVVQAVVDGYRALETKAPLRHFYVMECSNKNGGKLFPHRTHQNGLSVDFMMPKLKNCAPYTALDKIGAEHYWLIFDDNGLYDKDPSISIDFNLVAQHILLLQKAAQNNKLRIKKVIIKVEFKDELFATHYGKQLKQSGIYIVKALSPMINALHDEHFHIDFEPVN